MAVRSKDKAKDAKDAPDANSAPAPDAAAQAEPLWRGRLAGPDAIVRLVQGNLRHGWRLLLVVGLGLLIAVVLLSTVPLYGNLVGDVQLQAALNTNGPLGRNIEIVATSQGISDNANDPDSLRKGEDTVVQPLRADYLGAFTQSTVNNYLSSTNLGFDFINNNPAAPPGGGTVLKAYLLAYDYNQAGQQMQLLAGRFPQDTPLAQDGIPEALVTGQMARDRHVQVGDLLTLDGSNGSVVVRAVGVWQPADPADNYWNGRIFNVQPIITLDNDTYIYPVLLTPSAFTGALAGIPNFGMEHHWTYYTQTDRITSANMNQIAGQVIKFKQAAINVLSYGSSFPLQVQIVTQIDAIVPSVAAQLAVLSQPLYVIVAQVEGLALLFVGAMAGLLVDAQAGEIATLRSRGASGAQVLGGYALQGAALAAAAAALGPLLAGLVAVALVNAFIPAATRAAAGVSPALLATALHPQDAVRPALAGAALGIAAVVLAVWRATRLDVLAFRREQGRATRQPFWRRYYLDVLLAVVCVAGYAELNTFGGLGARETLGSQSTSPLLFATPALLLLAGALLTLRLFPIAAGLGARITARVRGATGMLAFAQIARSAGGALLVALLLALGVGLGLFAITFGTSLAHNAVDRAAYAVGADVRITESGPLTGGDVSRPQTELASLPGALGATPVYRGGATTADASTSPVGMLAIDPATWAQVAGVTSWRDDYAAVPLATLMNQLQAHQWPAGSFTPGEPTYLGDGTHPIWAIITQDLANTLHLSVGDHFALAVNNANANQTTFTVGAIVQYFPTLYPGQTPAGALVMGVSDLEMVPSSPPLGPDEFWVHTSGPQFNVALAPIGVNINVINVLDRRTVYATIGSSPLQSGMRGLLTAGAALAVGLAVLGSVVQSVLNARRRSVQFAVLRTIGMGTRQLRRLLLGEQAVVYAFGLVGGLALGVILAGATLPYLQFNDATLDASTSGVPPDRLVIEPQSLGIFCAVLALALLLGLFLTARAAARIGLGSTLRLGED